MATSRRNPSPSPSVSSVRSDMSTDLSIEEREVRALVKKKLSKRFFLGHYQERRYVEHMRVYRDMVVIHNSEVELQHDLDQIRVKLSSYYPSSMWVGITSPHTIGAPAAGYCLWVKLQDVPFGYYWFQIKQVRYGDNEIVLRISVIRPVSEEVVCPQAAPINLTQTLTSNIDALKSRLRTGIHSLTDAKGGSSKVFEGGPPQGDRQNAPSDVNSNKSGSCSSSQTPESNMSCDTASQPTKTEKLEWKDFIMLLQWSAQNWKELFTFMLGVLMTLASCIRYIGDFSLRFMREVTYFLRTVTPIMIAVVELVGKLVGGLYLLIAMTFNKRGGPPIRPGQFYQQKTMQAIQHGRGGVRRYN